MMAYRHAFLWYACDNKISNPTVPFIVGSIYVFFLSLMIPLELEIETIK